LLQLTWLRDGDAAPLTRALADGDRFLARVVTRLARREVVPRLAPGLRRLLGCDDDEVALALGTQGDPHDGPRLLARLRDRPDSLRLAVAVARCGHAASAAAARALWRPPQAHVQPLGDPKWLALARELGSPVLARALAREARRRAAALAAGSAEADPAGLRRLVLGFALLAPADGDIGALRHGLHVPGAPAAEEALSEVWPALREAGRAGAMSEALGRGPDEARAALAWCRRAREALPATERPLLRYEPFERGLRRLAASGWPQERAAALDLWLELTPPDRLAWCAAGCLALVGGDVGRLPADLRVRMARECWGEPGKWLSADHIEAGLTWLDGLPAEARDEALRAEELLARLPGRDAASRVWLLRLESPDTHRRETVEHHLRTWAQHAPLKGLLDLLDTALVWLAPGVAEPLAARLFAAVRLDSAALHGIVDWAGAKEMGSYRLGELVRQELLPRLDAGQRAELAGRIGQAGGRLAGGTTAEGFDGAARCLCPMPGDNARLGFPRAERTSSAAGSRGVDE
jgi:hypothetical protein